MIMQIANIKLEKNELSNNYKDQVEKIHLLLEEKDKIYSELDVMRTEQNKIYQEKEKINIEKEKLLLLKAKNLNEIESLNNSLNKLEIEKNNLQEKYSQAVGKYERERENLCEEKNSLSEKNDILTNEKILYTNEVDFLKHQETNTTAYIDKLESNNRNLFGENQNYQIEIEKLKIINENLQKSQSDKKYSLKGGDKVLITSNEIISSLNTNNSFSNSINNTLLNNHLKTLVRLVN